MVRFAVRQLLLRDIAYEEDPEFSTAARKVVSLVPDSFDLRLVTVINTQGSFEFAENLGAPLGEEARSMMSEASEVVVQPRMTAFQHVDATMSTNATSSTWKPNRAPRLAITLTSSLSRD